MPQPLQTHSGSQGLFHSSLLDPIPPRELIPVTTHMFVQGPTAHNCLRAGGFAPKGYEGVTAFCTALSTASVPHHKKSSFLLQGYVLSDEGSLWAHKLTARKSMFLFHHPFLLHTEDDESNRKYSLESAYLRVLANSCNLPSLLFKCICSNSAPCYTLALSLTWISLHQ